MTIWFTSDLHMGHFNIIKYSKRPYASVEEMDDALINNWNSKVADGDTVYNLGDFTFKQDSEARKYLRRLKGNIHFIKGNHDRKGAERIAHEFKSFNNLLEISVEGQEITLCHYAMRTWNNSHKNAWQLYGHSHGTLPDDPSSLSIDVGVDCHNYYPISFEEVKRIMAKKTYKPVDHHGNK